MRLINYCLIVGGTGPLDEWGIAGAERFTVPWVSLLTPTSKLLLILVIVHVHPRDMSHGLLMSSRAILTTLLMLFLELNID